MKKFILILAGTILLTCGVVWANNLLLLGVGGGGTHYSTGQHLLLIDSSHYLLIDTSNKLRIE